MDSPIRILGLVAQDMHMEGDKVKGKDGSIYNALKPPFQLIGIERPIISKPIYYFNALRSFDPNRDRWRSRASINAWIFHYRSQLIEKALREHNGDYDLILQIHTLFSPDIHNTGRRFALTTDNTFALTQRYWPDWAPMSNDAELQNYLALERQVYQKAALLFAWSDLVRESLIDDYGVKPDKIVKTSMAPSFEIPSHLDKNNYDNQVVLFVGNEFQRKGGFVLLQAWEKIHRAYPSARLLILGPRKPLAAPMPGVEWLGRIADRERVKAIFREASVFVLPSFFEPFALALMEAMSQGLPCITTTTCGLADSIREGNAGFIIPPGNAAELESALRQFLADPQLTATLGRNAHRQAQANHSKEVIFERMAPALRQIAGAGALVR